MYHRLIKLLPPNLLITASDDFKCNYFSRLIYDALAITRTSQIRAHIIIDPERRFQLFLFLCQLMDQFEFITSHLLFSITCCPEGNCMFSASICVDIQLFSESMGWSHLEHCRFATVLYNTNLFKNIHWQIGRSMTGVQRRMQTMV